MPFGPNCEYEKFSDCVKANRDKDDPEAYCAELERRTKEHCDAADAVAFEIKSTDLLADLKAIRKRHGG